MTDIYIPKAPYGYMYRWSLTQTACRVNIENWRLCAKNAADQGRNLQRLYCEAKARKIAGWLEDLIEEEGVR